MRTLDDHVAWLQQEHGLTYVATRKVEGEMFAVMRTDSGSIVYSHPTWSVDGAGSTILEAEMNLIANGCELYQEIAFIPMVEMSQDLINCAYWCGRCLLHRTEQAIR